MKRMGLWSLALVAAVTWGCSDKHKDTAANAPAGSAVGTAGSNEVSRADKDFVHDVAIANMAEIDAGNLAVARAAMPDVKKFAQMMIEDHTGAGEKLKTVATQYNIEVPPQVDDKAQKVHDKLAAKTGVDFDKDYADAMIDGHQDFVDKLESRIDKTKLADWKTTHASPGKTTTEKVETEAITPEKSDNPVTAAINQWAADTYPTAWAHLQAAKDLQTNLKKRTTN